MRYSWKPKVILMTSTPHTSDYKHIVEFTIKKSFCSCPHGCAACRGGLRYYKEFQIRIAQKPRAIKTCTSSPILSSKAPPENRTRKRKVPGALYLSIFLGGFVIWGLDRVFCSTIRRWRHEVDLPWGVLLEGHG